MSHHRRDPRDQSFCPSCGYLFDTDTNVGFGRTNAPKRGDFTVCLKCGAISRYGRRAQMTPLTLAELKGLADPAQIREIALYRLQIATMKALGIRPSFGFRTPGRA